MKSHLQNIGRLAGVGVIAVLLVTTAFAGGKSQTLTGQVSDAMCGTKHMMGDAVKCTQACVQKGSKYALVVGDKVYTLEASDKAALATLDKMAGQTAKVTGTIDGDTMQVTAVSAH